jgi:F-type H+-transporting ATPase subunit b
MTAKLDNHHAHWVLRFGAGAVVVTLPSFAIAAEEGGMPQFDTSTFPTQLAWLTITFVLFFLAMRQVVMPRIADVLEARRNRIDGDLDRAQALKEEAEIALAAYEKTVAESLAKAHDLQRDSVVAFAEQAAKNRSELAERLSAETQTAERRIAEEVARSLTEVRGMAAELVRATASRLAGIEISGQEANAAIAARSSEDKQ